MSIGLPVVFMRNFREMKVISPITRSSEHVVGPQQGFAQNAAKRGGLHREHSAQEMVVFFDLLRSVTRKISTKRLTSSRPRIG
jgi:hypothetical protein